MTVSFLEKIAPWFDAGLSFLYPEVCQICGERRATRAESYVCADCRNEAQTIEPPFCNRCGRPFEGAITIEFECETCRETEPHYSTARAAVFSKGVVLEVIHRYKYQRALWFEPFLAGLLIEAARPQLAGQNWDYIVPVPLHRTKQREREFNQAARLARRLSVATGIPLHNRLLRRVVPTRTQTQLTRQERLANVRRAFALHPRSQPEGKRLILLDDVFTTGATTNACAGVLRAGGAAEVCVWTVARGI